MHNLENVTVELTAEEANELFSRCLNDSSDDNDVSQSVLQKLARALMICRATRYTA